MAIDTKTLAAARKYTDQSVAGGGAIKGKNCTIDSISPITGGNRVTFKWTLDDGTVQTGTMDVLDGSDGAQGPAGADGLGIASVDIDANNHLIITYDDGTTHDAGEIPGGGGTGEVISVNGKKGVVKLYATDIPMSDAAGAQTIALEISQLHGSLLNKVDKEAGKGLSTNDFSNIDKAKLDALLGIKSAGSGLNFNPTTGELTATGASIAIDTVLDPTSTNPVQNQAIAIPVQALQGSVLTKADKTEVNQIKLDVTQLQGSVLSLQTNKADKTEVNQIKLDVTQLQGSVLGLQTGKADKTEVNQIKLDVTQLQGSILTKADKTEVNQIKLDVTQLQGSVLSLTNDLTYKADKTDLDSWIGPEYIDANHKVAFDDLDDTQAYKLFGKDRILRIDGQPHKDPGTSTGTVKVTYTTDAPQGTECWLRMIKK